MKRTIGFVSVFLSAALLLAVLARPAQTCVSSPPRPPSVWITFHPDGSVWILFHGYITFGAQQEQFCACALNQVGPITAVNAAAVTNVRTGEQIAGFQFESNQNTSDGFNRLAMGTPGQGFKGFASAVSEVIPAGTPVDVMFNVSVAAGSSPTDLANALSSASVLVATDEAEPDGTPKGIPPGAGGHLAIKPAGDVMIMIECDIKPGSDPNSINPKSKGVIPVAILGSASFDVRNVDLANPCKFGRNAAEPVHDLSDPAALDKHLEDVNGDGHMDLITHYRTQDTGIAAGDTEACLTGVTVGGASFECCDTIVTRPRGRRRRP